MSAYALFIRDAGDRAKAHKWVEAAPIGASLLIKLNKRSLDQNALLWSMLYEVARQVEWYGQYLSAEDWKCIFTASLRKSRAIPGIDPGSFVVVGLHTSDMTKNEFSQLLELIHAFGAEHNVVFQDQRAEVAA